MEPNEESQPPGLGPSKVIQSSLDDTGHHTHFASPEGDGAALPQNQPIEETSAQPNEHPELSKPTMSVRSPLDDHDVLTGPPDGEDNALPPSSPFQSLLEPNEPNDDDALPLDNTSDKSSITIKAEDQDTDRNEAPKKRSRASKTPPPDTPPHHHAIPMSEPKPKRATKDKAEKKRTRASNRMSLCHTVIPRPRHHSHHYMRGIWTRLRRNLRDRARPRSQVYSHHFTPDPCLSQSRFVQQGSKACSSIRIGRRFTTPSTCSLAITLLAM